MQLKSVLLYKNKVTPVSCPKISKGKIFVPNPRQKQDRYTWQQRQEDRSINQFRDRMHEFGWLPDRAERDIGEDLIVRILTNHQPVGIPFYAQLKSVSDLLDRKKGDSLVYRLEVVDLLRWENSSVPVVLFVWDVNQRDGRWVTIKSLVDQIDKRKRPWRNQKTITVYLPWDNTTSDRSLRELRMEIGHLLYPLIANDRNVEISLNILLPSSEDNLNDRVQLEKFFREGTPVSIDSQYIQDVAFSEWWAEWFFEQDIEIREIKILPHPHPDPEPVSIMLLSPGCPTAHFPDVELRLIRSGTDLSVFSNEHQSGPVSFTLMFPKGSGEKKVTVTYRVNHVGYNVLETREIVRLQQGIRAGGKLTILFKNHGGASLSMKFQSLSENRSDSIDLDQRYIDLVETLCFIQEASGYQIRLPEGDISHGDVRAAYELKEILGQGKTVGRTKALCFTVNDVGMIKKLCELHRDGENGSILMIQQDVDESHVKLFGQDMQVGPMTKTVVGKLAMTIEEMEDYIQLNDGTSPFELQLSEVEITEKFAHWQSNLL